MKKYILSLITVLLLSGTAAFAQSCEISGKIAPGVQVRNDIVGLFRITDGTAVMIKSVPVAEDSTFLLVFNIPNEGYYSVGIADVVKGMKILQLYLKKGENIKMTIDTIEAKYVGKVSPENTILSKWYRLIEPLKNKAVYNRSTGTGTPYQEFFPLLEATAKQAEVFSKSINTTNPKFNALMKDQVRFDVDFYAINYITNFSENQIPKSSLTPYYNTIITKNKFTNDNVLALNNGAPFMGKYIDYATDFNDAPLDKKLELLSTDRQKGAYLFENVIMKIKGFDQYEQVIGKYGQYFQLAYQKSYVEDLRGRLADLKVGSKALSFTCPDKDGKNVSLNDFIGKVVLIDLWATWCGPCKAEIPSLKKLEKELKDSAIVFLSISLDEEKDKEKWLKMVNDEQLGGVQLFAGGFTSKIAKDYSIRSIPRFIVVDKRGNIANPDASRPSEPALKEFLEYVLRDYKIEKKNIKS